LSENELKESKNKLPLDNVTLLYYIKNMNSKEPMFVTWGRIYALSGLSEIGKPKFNKRKLQKLIKKFDSDLENVKIEEGYYSRIPEHDCHMSPEDGCQVCEEVYERMGGE